MNLSLSEVTQVNISLKADIDKLAFKAMKFLAKGVSNIAANYDSPGHSEYALELFSIFESQISVVMEDVLETLAEIESQTLTSLELHEIKTRFESNLVNLDRLIVDIEIETASI